MNNELERTWKEAIVAIVEVPSRHFPEETEENHENLSHDSRSPGPRFQIGTYRIGRWNANHLAVMFAPHT
jgi:hypothetical protein